MYYHAIVKAQGDVSYHWNYSKDRAIQELLVPFVNGQVISILTRKGPKLFNLKTVTTMSFLKTEVKLDEPPPGRIPSMLAEPNLYDFIYTDELLREIRQLNSSPKLNSLLQMSFNVPLDQVFVIMKFGDKHLDSAYEGVIKPIIHSFNLRAIRIDEIQDSGQITDQVLECIAKSRYVLADLSGGRPNCYYETGFAHALGKELILTVQEKDSIHFDLAGYRFIRWETEADLRRSLQERFESLIHSGSSLDLSFPKRFDEGSHQTRF